MDLLPVEVDENIALSIHPYYVRSICNVSKSKRNECDAWTYQALQKWVYPEKTIPELRRLFPVLYFNDVVYLALVFNPIPESKSYFDSMTLFYHACRTGDRFPPRFITYYASYPHLLYIQYIAYKFNRIDILRHYIDSAISPTDSELLKVMVNLLRVKSGLGPLYPVGGNFDNMIVAFMYKYPLFTYEEIIEFVILFAGVVYTGENIFNDEEEYYWYLVTDDVELGSNEDELTFMHIARKVGKDKIIELVRKYKLAYHRKTDYEIPFVYDFPELGVVPTGNPNSVTLYDNHDLITKCIPEDKLGIYYVTSGDFAAYINWLREKERDIIPLEIPYCGTNEFRWISLDRDLVDATKDDKDSQFHNISLDAGTMLDPQIVTYNFINQIPFDPWNATFEDESEDEL